jgi:hypothetical protein
MVPKHCRRRILRACTTRATPTCFPRSPRKKRKI